MVYNTVKPLMKEITSLLQRPGIFIREMLCEVIAKNLSKKECLPTNGVRFREGYISKSSNVISIEIITISHNNYILCILQSPENWIIVRNYLSEVIKEKNGIVNIIRLEDARLIILSVFQ